MFCNECNKLALKQQLHKCSNCDQPCEYKEQKVCNKCSEKEYICSICNKTMKIQDTVKQVHSFFGSSGGCKNCGR